MIYSEFITILVGYSMQMLENYFIQKNLEHLLSFKNAESVDKPTQRLLVNTIVDFMVATFGDAKEVTLGRRQMTARSTIILFPFLKYKDSKSDGTVCITNKNK